MIYIGFNSPNIVASIMNTKTDVEFQSSVSILKSQKFMWNPNTKLWELSAILYTDMLYDALRMITDVYFPDVIKQQIINYPKLLPSELQINTNPVTFQYSDLIKEPFKPIVGKHPFENYQDEDIRRSLQQNRFLFNWSMGLGKSFATAVIYEFLRTQRGIDKMILLTSRIGTYNLQNELSKFCLHLDKNDIQVFNSPKSFKKTTRLVFDNEDVCKKHVLVFSYDSWKLITSAYGDTPRSRNLKVPLDNFFTNDSDKLICLDECHYLSNPKSNRSKALFRYLKLFKYRYLFSATPADKPEKLYSICLMLDPKLCRYLKYNDWIQKYNDIGTWFSKYAINKKKWHEDELRELNNELSLYSAKRVAEDVLNLPPCRIETIDVEMSEKQRKLYQEFTNDIVNNCIKKQPDLDSASVDIIQEAFSTVMSFVENPNIIGMSSSELISDSMKEKCSKYNFNSDYVKLDTVDAILEDEVDEKEKRGIVWYIHPKTKDEIIKRYEKYKPIVISADMSEEERDFALQTFKNNDSHKILIASQYILATSVTITECTFAVYLEVAFSYIDYFQSTGRIYRIGQTQPVTIYHIWIPDSTDLFHQQALSTKKDLTQFLFSGKRPVLNLEQIRDLFLGKL